MLQMFHPNRRITSSGQIGVVMVPGWLQIPSSTKFMFEGEAVKFAI